MDYQTSFGFNQEVEFKIDSFDLRFDKPAKTSRDTLTERTIYFVKARYKTQPAIIGVGECSPIYGLSPEKKDKILSELNAVCEKIQREGKADLLQIESPAVRFAFEVALNDLINGGRRVIFPHDFSAKSIPINGLVWMNNAEDMLKEALIKASLGFTTIKFKVGALDFEEELRLLSRFRKHYPTDRMIIRLDANGAFKREDVFEKLNALALFGVHSIEQPTDPKYDELMKEIIDRKIIPIALDEHLIGKSSAEKESLIRSLMPDYLVLKPMLHGGISGCKEWIIFAEKYGVRYWVTSMLESSVGLNAIAQWVQSLGVMMPQGLGTGGLYVNNLPAAWIVKDGALLFDQLDELKRETSTW